LPPSTRRVLIDECIDWRLSRHLRPHHVASVVKMGWSGLKNGRLLREAEPSFDVFVTVHRNLSFQQHVVRFDLAVIVLKCATNRLKDMEPLVPKLLKTIATAESGQVLFV
jgi:hypothetical protein